MLIKVNYNLSSTLNDYRDMLDPGSELQKEIDNKVLKDIGPYVPYRNGRLHRSALANSQVGSGRITWSTPYARSVWYGKSKSGGDMVFDKSRHPLAGPRWTERYKADHISGLREMVVRRVRQL